MYGDLRSTKLAIAPSAASNWAPVSTTVERRLGVDHRVPGLDRLSRSPKIAAASCDRAARTRAGSNCVPARRGGQRRPRRRRRRVRWATSTILGEVGDPRRERDLVAGAPARPALSVPPLVGTAPSASPTAGVARSCSASSCGQRGHGGRACRRARGARRRRTPSRCGSGATADARRRAGATSPPAPARPTQVLVVLGGLQGDVVTEPLRLLVRVGVASHVDQQRGVVDDRPGLARPDPSAPPTAAR